MKKIITAVAIGLFTLPFIASASDLVESTTTVATTSAGGGSIAPWFLRPQYIPANLNQAEFAAYVSQFK